ncbi:MAG: hypothetical protein ABI091_31640 [Ferruginibacter sp.]
MMINRNNYETYFLLYIDNELSVAERKAVEEFVAQHTDLQEELDQLQSTVLPLDDISFAGKMDLFKSQAHDELLQEKMLLHLDDELDKEHADAIEELIEKDSYLKADWEILQRTKLDATETIEFPYKDLLYRRERDNVIIGRFVKWAVAAAILGAGFFFGVSILSKQNKIDNVAVNSGTKNVKKANEDIPVIKKQITPDEQQVVTPKDDETKEENLATASGKKIIETPKENEQKEENLASTSVKEITNKVTDKTDQQKIQEQKNNIAVNKQKTKSNISQQAAKEEAVNDEKILMAVNKNQKPIELNTDIEIKNTVAIQSPKIKPATANTLTDTNLAALDNSMARTAGLTDANAEANNDRILYMKEENVSRSKAGIFFKKVKRIVERTTNIKTDKGLRIGGFEVALK